jgi:hypothetical protein
MGLRGTERRGVLNSLAYRNESFIDWRGSILQGPDNRGDFTVPIPLAGSALTVDVWE